MNNIYSIVTNPWMVVILIIIVGLYIFWQKRGKSLTGPSMLSVYTRDLTAEARTGKTAPVIGRQNEIERVIHILARKTKNNPILLGEAGVGKTAIVEGLAQRIIAGDAPENLKDKRLLGLDLGGLISGTKYRGEFEERIKKLLNEILREQRQVILFIDEVHMIVQAKGSEGALNVSDILKPTLARGDLQAIGATTQEEYERYIKPDDALDRRFQPVLVGEPQPSAALAMLEGIKKIYEDYHHVEFAPSALKAAVELSAKYIKERFLPDKAIDLIDEAGAKVSIEDDHEARHAAGLLHAAGCKRNSQPRKYDDVIPIVGVQDIREIVSEWVGVPIEKII